MIYYIYSEISYNKLSIYFSHILCFIILLFKFLLFLLNISNKSLYNISTFFNYNPLPFLCDISMFLFLFLFLFFFINLIILYIIKDSNNIFIYKE
jgi:hypothetical protein